ncbi:hypothetical protein GF386_04065 [Candidatus Pacearchaeota archaeon]|nr:hypothetical protein [Candidatus Pacearchaeota archaeon]
MAIPVSADWYEMPTSNDTEGLYGLFKFINNETTGGLFMPVILIVIWMISFTSVFSVVGGTRAAAARGWVFASFLVSILAILASIMEMLNPKFMYLPFIALAFGMLWLRLESPSIE